MSVTILCPESQASLIVIAAPESRALSTRSAMPERKELFEIRPRATQLAQQLSVKFSAGLKSVSLKNPSFNPLFPQIRFKNQNCHKFLSYSEGCGGPVSSLDDVIISLARGRVRAALFLTET